MKGEYPFGTHLFYKKETMTAPRIVDFLLLGGTIVTMDADRHLIQSGAIAIRDSRVVWIGAADQTADLFDPLQTLDVTAKVVIPGMVNTHGHWAMTLFRGFVDDLTLEAWLEKIWKVEAAVLSPENVVAGAELAILEMIRSGTTCAADMYWHYPESCDAARRAGFRVVNGPSFADIPGFEDRPDMNYRAAIGFLDRYQGDPLIHLCMQAHSTYTTNPQMLEDILRITKERNIGFITHAAEFTRRA